MTALRRESRLVKQYSETQLRKGREVPESWKKNMPWDNPSVSEMPEICKKADLGLGLTLTSPGRQL
jgi:hypothetical protein